jgi:hypothetical protein
MSVRAGGRKQAVRGTRRSVEDMKVSHVSKECGISVQVMGRLTESGVAASAHPLSGLPRGPFQRNRGMNGASQGEKMMHELGHVLARMAPASSLAFSDPSAAKRGGPRMAMSSASSPTSLRRSSWANLRLTFAKSTAST